MIEAGRCRSLINKDVNRLRGMYRWAVVHELVPVAVYQALQAVAGLRRGRTEAKEVPPIGPVAREHVEAVLPHLSPQISAMVQLQLLTGARPGEVISLRPSDVTRGEDGVWVYRPREHKTEHHNRSRVILVGPRAQEVLRPWLARDPEAFCFCPAEVVAVREGRRQDPSLRGRGVGRRRAARPRPGGRYTKDSYRVAVQRACRRAGVPLWSPIQLRHAAATLVRARFDLESARVVLGHEKADTTLIYAEMDMERAREVMTAMG
jgi:integrase